MARIEHAGAAPETTLAAPIGSGDLSLVADDLSGYPTGSVGSFYIVIDPGTSSAEKILLSSRSGDNATVASGGRGADDTVAVPHLAGAVIQHVFTASEADDANAHIEATAGVHGTSTEVVGIDDSQTLTNKAISGASNTISNVDVASILFAAGWQTALETALGANWQTAVNTALGANWTTAFQNALGTDWTDALDSALGNGWVTKLAAAVASGTLLTDSSTATLTNKTIDGDNNTLQDIPQSALVRAVLNLEGDGTDFNVGHGDTRMRTTFTTTTNVGGFTVGGNSAERIIPHAGMYLVTHGGRVRSSSSAADEEFELRIYVGGTAGNVDGDLVTRFGGNMNTAGTPEGYANGAEVLGSMSAGDRVKFVMYNSTGATITDDGNGDFKHAGLIWLGPGS